MELDKDKSKVQESLAQLYLRLNGFFTTGFIVPSPDPGHNLTEIDVLALRMPHNAEPERELGPHELLKLSSNYIDLVICEVKSKGQQIKFNRKLTETPQTVDAALQWAGLFTAEELPELCYGLHQALAQSPLPSSGPPCIRDH